MEVKYEDLEGVEHCDIVDVPIANNLKVHLRSLQEFYLLIM